MFFALLNECNSLWLTSGLEEALASISNHNNFDVDGISRELVESIKYIHEFDEHALHSYMAVPSIFGVLGIVREKDHLHNTSYTFLVSCYDFISASFHFFLRFSLQDKSFF